MVLCSLSQSESFKSCASASPVQELHREPKCPATATLTLNCDTTQHWSKRLSQPYGGILLCIGFLSCDLKCDLKVPLSLFITVSVPLFSCLSHAGWLQWDMQSQQPGCSCTGSSHRKPPSQLVHLVSRMGTALYHRRDLWKWPRVPISSSLPLVKTPYIQISLTGEQMPACCLRRWQPVLTSSSRLQPVYSKNIPERAC